MLCKACCGIVFVFLCSSLCLGQEATKAEPQHYKLAFENEYVQVVNVHYGPHEKSGMHAHPGGVVVNLTPSHMRMTDEHGKSREVHSLAGEARWFPPFKHSVENLDNTVMNSVYIGIKHYHGESARKNGAPVMDSKTEAIVAQAIAVALTSQQAQK